MIEAKARALAREMASNAAIAAPDTSTMSIN